MAHYNGYGERIYNPNAYYNAVNQDRYGYNSYNSGFSDGYNYGYNYFFIHRLALYLHCLPYNL